MKEKREKTEQELWKDKEGQSEREREIERERESKKQGKSIYWSGWKHKTTR